MENVLLQEKLNKVKDDIQGKTENCSVTLEVGNHLELLNKLLRQTAYFGKVAIFAYEKTFTKLAKNIKSELLKNKITTYDYLFTYDDKLNVEQLSKLFTLPEDLRAVIVFDSKLSNIAGYFATIKKLPVYFVTGGLDIGEILESSFYIKNDNTIDLFSICAKKILIIDKSLNNLLEKTYSIAYDYIVNNVVSLLDEKINSFFSGEKINVSLYNKKNKAVIDTFSIMKISEKDRYDALVVNSAICGLVNSCNKRYMENNSLNNCALLLFKDSFVNNSVLLAFTIKILNFYALLCSTESEKLFIIKDYNSIAYELSSLLQIDEEVILDNLIAQDEGIRNSKKSLKEFREKYANEIIPLSSAFDKAGLSHLALSGEDIFSQIKNDDLKKIIRSAGGLTNSVTGLALLIHSGISEII